MGAGVAPSCVEQDLVILVDYILGVGRRRGVEVMLEDLGCRRELSLCLRRRHYAATSRVVLWPHFRATHLLDSIVLCELLCDVLVVLELLCDVFIVLEGHLEEVRAAR